MKINSKRIILREFQVLDWPMLHSLYTKPETIKFNPSGYPESDSATRDLVSEWANMN